MHTTGLFIASVFIEGYIWWRYFSGWFKLTQVLATIHPEGIVVATDSRAWSGPTAPVQRYFSVEKLFPLGERAFILSAGLGVGIPLSLRFQAFVSMHREMGPSELLKVAGPILSRYLNVLLARTPLEVYQDPLARVLILIGLIDISSPKHKHKMMLYVSEKGRLPMEEHPIGGTITIPRLLGAEMLLHRMCRDEAPMEDLLHFMREVLIRRTREEKGIGPPFFWAVLDQEGLHRGKWEEDVKG
jgi:hypothetical protein